MKKDFNPNDYDTTLTVLDICKKFPYLKELDFQEVSLAKEITNLNYEVTSSLYEDFTYSSIEDYFDIEVDTIV